MKSMVMASLATVILGMSANVFACTKEDAKQNVEAVCSEIEKKGAAIKADWDAPGSKKLIFNNCAEYVWVQDTDAAITIVKHPVKDRLTGTSQVNFKDKNGFQLFAEFDKAIKKTPGGAWVDYLWNKPGNEEATPKTSFVKLCKGPDGVKWIAGSGIWLSDAKK